MARAPSLFVSLFVALGALATSESAFAFCRTKACDTDPSYGDIWDEAPQPEACVRNAQGCYLDGTPLYWPSRCLSFGVQRDGSASSGIDFETARAVIADAFAKWAAADCGGDTPSFRVVDQGEISCETAEYNQKAPNANVFLFRDNDWPYSNAIDTLALTTITYNVETAEIYDADVEMNSHQTTFTVTDESFEIISDLSSVITHEVGHFLGLSHSSVDTAVMRGVGYTTGSTDLRELTPDDIGGICQIFPPGESTSGSCEPRHGFSRECGGDVKESSGGCAMRSSKTTDARALAAFAALIGVFVARRARHRRWRG
jgi:hypothetical protein